MTNVMVNGSGAYYLSANMSSETLKEVKTLLMGVNAKKGNYTVVFGFDEKYPDAGGIFTTINNELVQISWVSKKAENGCKTLEEFNALRGTVNYYKANLVKSDFTSSSGKLSGTGVFEISMNSGKTVDAKTTVTGSTEIPSNSSEVFYIIGCGPATAINTARYKGVEGQEVKVAIKSSTATIFLLNGGEKPERCCYVGNESVAETEAAIAKAHAAGISVSFVTDLTRINEIFGDNTLVINAKIEKVLNTKDYVIKVTATKDVSAEQKKIDDVKALENFLNSISEANKQNVVERVNYLKGLADMPTAYIQKYLQMWADADKNGSVFTKFHKVYEDVETMGSTVMSLICQEAITTNNILLVGEKGTGKNKAIETFQSLWGGKFSDNSMNCETGFADMVGGQGLAENENGNIVTEFNTSSMLDAIEEYSVVNIDELNLAAPAMLMSFQPLLDDRRCIEIAGIKGEGHKKNRHVNCVITGTMNEGRGYQGTRAQNEAFRDRFAIIKVPACTDISKILKNAFPSVNVMALKRLGGFYSKCKASHDIEPSIRKFFRAAEAMNNGIDIRKAVLTRIVETCDNEKERVSMLKLVDTILGPAD